MAGWTNKTTEGYNGVPRILFDEIYWAVEERIRFLRKDSARNPSDYPLPIFYYNKDDDIEWNGDNPKKVISRVRRAHTYNLRYQFGMRHSSVTYDYPLDYPGTTGKGVVEANDFRKDYFIDQFAKKDDIYNFWDGDSGTIHLFHQQAFGKDYFTDGYLEKGTQGRVKMLYIEEARKCVEQLVLVKLNPVSLKYQERRGDFSGVHYEKTQRDTIYAATKNAWDAASWGAWSAGTLYPAGAAWEFYKEEYVDYTGDSNYVGSGYLWTRRYKVKFDLDLEIVDGINFPPSYHPYENWDCIMPPLSAKGLAYRTYWDINASDYPTPPDPSDILLRNDTTDVFVGVGETGDGVVIDDDLIADFGSGHDEEEYILTSKNDWDATEMSDCRFMKSPAVGNNAYGWTLQLLLKNVNTADKKQTAGFWIICQPNWKYGAPELS